MREANDPELREIDAKLFDAVDAADVAAATRLIDDGADVNVRGCVGVTPLIRAADVGSEELVRLLLERGAEVNVQDAWNDTALLCAAHEGWTEIMRLLLEHGADAGPCNRSGATAITTTLIYDERYEQLETLLRGGADPNQRDGRGDLPIVEALGDPEYLRLLLQYGASIDVQDNNGWSLLERAHRHCCHQAVPILEQLGAKL